MPEGNCAGVRAFIGYSHADRNAAHRFAHWLSAAGGCPLWDAQLHAGERFREELLTLIGNAHVFVALLSESSMKRPWVLQEMGYAAALNIPIIPISAGPLPEGLIGDLHALRVSTDWSDLEKVLPTVDWLRLKGVQVRHPSTVLATLTRSTFDRLKVLVTYAERALSIGDGGLLRQRAGLSTFSIPDASVIHRIWDDHDGPTPRTADHHELQRQERRIFETQARSAGCKLIINPHVRYSTQSKKTRLSTLCAFISDPRTDDRIQVIPNRREFSGNLTIFGDWWVAESLLPRLGGYRETTFTWHPGTVKRFSDAFDEEFDYLCAENRVTPTESRFFALEEIKRALAACDLGASPS